MVSTPNRKITFQTFLFKKNSLYHSLNILEQKQCGCLKCYINKFGRSEKKSFFLFHVAYKVFKYSAQLKRGIFFFFFLKMVETQVWGALLPQCFEGKGRWVTKLEFPQLNGWAKKTFIWFHPQDKPGGLFVCLF